ncbi:MAG: alkaline shock response membrane anchor protein AmaP [Methanoregula sp.]|jgi:threonine/homoserine/homoserine lactone efflux protein|nr:alkaline shock response membrane anchor protein AmaP [Methanoregula sp.]
MNEPTTPGAAGTGQPAEPAARVPPTLKKPGTEWFSALYAIILLFVFIAAFQLYFSMQDIIRTWVSDQYIPVFNTVYYIVIIVVGIWLIRDYIRRQ